MSDTPTPEDATRAALRAARLARGLTLEGGMRIAAPEGFVLQERTRDQKKHRRLTLSGLWCLSISYEADPRALLGGKASAADLEAVARLRKALDLHTPSAPERVDRALRVVHKHAVSVLSDTRRTLHLSLAGAASIMGHKPSWKARLCRIEAGAVGGERMVDALFDVGGALALLSHAGRDLADLVPPTASVEAACR